MKNLKDYINENELISYSKDIIGNAVNEGKLVETDDFCEFKVLSPFMLFSPFEFLIPFAA